LNKVSVLGSALGLLVASATLAIGAQLAAAVPAREAYPLPTGWRVYPIPASDSKDWWRANRSGREWQVSLVDGRVHIEKVQQGESEPETPEDDLPFKIEPQKRASGWVTIFDEPPPPPGSSIPIAKWMKTMRAKKGVRKERTYRHEFVGRRTSVQVANGWIVGFDAGEFGGGLYWFNPDGSRHRQIKKTVGRYDSENVVDLIERKGTVLVLQGLDHLSLDRGKLLVLNPQKDGTWDAKVFADLGSRPQLCIEDRGESWLLVTNRAVLRVGTKGVIERMGTYEFPKWVHSNSGVRAADGVVYLGMRHFVARLIPDGKRYRAELLVPTDMPLFDPDPVVDSMPGPMNSPR
jgi:hypothetical protein